jgi:hypothetical protein
MITSNLSLPLLTLALSCGGASGPQGIQQPGGEGVGSTGLEGTVLSGPTRPVCLVDQPCTAPFKSGFEVRQTGQVVARFESDSDGHFLILLAPGTYSVSPDASAPLLARADAHQVTVGPGELTHVQLEFDTGIR